MVDMPLSGLMTIGIDISHDTRDRSKSFSAVVATMDLKTCQAFFSTVSAHQNGEEMCNELLLSVAKALHQYESIHHELPKKICIYRDGVGEGQTKYVYDHEVMQLKAKLESIYESSKSEHPLKMCFIVVSKKINTRIFTENQKNPPAGTVVDDVITLPERLVFIIVYIFYIYINNKSF